MSGTSQYNTAHSSINQGTKKKNMAVPMYLDTAGEKDVNTSRVLEPVNHSGPSTTRGTA